MAALRRYRIIRKGHAPQSGHGDEDEDDLPDVAELEGASLAHAVKEPRGKSRRYLRISLRICVCARALPCVCVQRVVCCYLCALIDARIDAH